MNARYMVICVMGILCAAVASAWPPDMEVTPSNPTTEDVVNIRLYGEWSNSCVPTGSELSWLGGGILFFAVEWDYPPVPICLTMITPWEQTQEVGPLPAGLYDVYAACYDSFGDPMYWPMWAGDFVVTSWTCAGDLNCDGVVDANDISPFVLALSNPAAFDDAFPDCDRSCADINGDGAIDIHDINPFVELLSAGG